MATDPAYISVREAARLLGVHDNTVRRYADRGMLRVARLPSGVRRLVRDDVEALTPRGTDQAIPKSWLSNFEPIPGDRAVAERWGEITGHAIATGRPRPANDAWIAACCLTHGLPLATLNPRDYEGITGLR
ncbi:MAG: helix-turn-helix domain-containing protein, partial [Solirubrobacterales bacterium]|nr:helix-turn-helix domain-containing protein [Solirubrobacterales bacterium]